MSSMRRRAESRRGSPSGTRQWLLLWSQHPDAGSARTAARGLRGASGAWPRKVGPLQDEARGAR